MTAPGPLPLPLVIFETNILFDFFLGRDPDVQLLAHMSGHQIDVRVPEFVLMEFRGSILRELGRKKHGLDDVRRLAKELERADWWMSGVDSLLEGCELVEQDIAHLRTRIDRFIDAIGRTFEVVPHSMDLHYLGDVRYIRGRPPDDPQRSIQDCRVLEAVLSIARADKATVRPKRYFLTKDSHFGGKQAVRDELNAVGVELVDQVGLIYGRHGRAMPQVVAHSPAP